MTGPATAPAATPAAEAPFDLAAYAHRYVDGEWHLGPDRGLTFGGYPLVATAEPDDNGHTAVFDRIGFTRDQLPELIAFLGAVYAASGPVVDTTPRPGGAR